MSVEVRAQFFYVEMDSQVTVNMTTKDRIKREYLLDKLFWLRRQIPQPVPTSDYEFIFNSGMFTTNKEAEHQLKAKIQEMEAEISAIQTELETFNGQ
jgi:hypothetical protein